MSHSPKSGMNRSCSSFRCFVLCCLLSCVDEPPRFVAALIRTNDQLVSFDLQATKMWSKSDWLLRHSSPFSLSHFRSSLSVQCKKPLHWNACQRIRIVFEPFQDGRPPIRLFVQYKDYVSRSFDRLQSLFCSRSFQFGASLSVDKLHFCVPSRGNSHSHIDTRKAATQ
jgi:hypothetical protein